LKNVIPLLNGVQALALTATATPYVRNDIIQQLGLRNPQTFVSGFDRPNLTIDVIHTEREREKIANIMRLAKKHEGSGIIYATTRKAVEQVAAGLWSRGLTVAAYHAGMPDSQRIKAQEDFMNGRTQMIVATNAFGMGIDKPDIRFVAHYQMPGSIEAYYQEIGRAGRDGLNSSCVLLFNYADKNTHDFFIDGSYPSVAVVRSVYEALMATGTKRIELSTSEIASLAGESNEMAVQSSLYLLERAGHIERGAPINQGTPRWEQPHEKQFRGRIRTLFVLDEAPTQLRINPGDVMRRASLERRKLREMIEFCYTERCYRAYILDYFGDRHHARHCGTCGNCSPQANVKVTSSHTSSDLLTPVQKSEPVAVAPRSLTEDETLRVRKILACAKRMNGRFGKKVLAATLRGSASKSVMRAKLNELSTYGLLSDMRQEDIALFIDALVAARCLLVNPGEYPTVGITELGERVMREQDKVELAIPETLSVITKAENGPVPATALKTHELFLKGHSVSEIASQRNLVPETIEGHLIACLNAGLPLDTSRLVSVSDRLEIEKALAKHGSGKLKPVRDALPETITYNMIRFVVADACRR
jgi:ATP-dependent DNA helicase RecQ